MTKSYENTDVIAVLHRGLSPGIEEFKSYEILAGDRLILFYPRKVTLDTSKYLREAKPNDDNEITTRDKYESFQTGFHQVIQETINSSINLSYRAIIKRIDDKMCDWKRENIIKILWPEITYDEFIDNPALRLSDKPNLNNRALLIDHQIDSLQTARFAVYDMFLLGYTQVEFHSGIDYFCQHHYEGNLEAFEKEYKGKNLQCIDFNILKM